MGRGKAAFTQSGLCRILSASRLSGVALRAILPDGTIIETVGKDIATAANDNASVELNDFEDLLDDRIPAQLCQ
jgi:hypothetical protein